MNRPVISVLLPTYNGSAYLREAVESISAQTFENWQLILIDDASTDDTPSIIQEFMARDSRICSCRHSTNRRLPAALNTGFQLARGDYISWTSDDNRYCETALQEMLTALQQDSSTHIVYADFDCVHADGTHARHVHCGSQEQLSLHNCIGACFLYRREVQEHLSGYREESVLAEDWDFWLRASQSFTMRHLPRSLYRYRLHEGSLTRQRQHAIDVASRQVLERNLRDVTWKTNSHRSRSYFHLAKRSYRLGDVVSGSRQLATSIYACPITALRELHALGRESVTRLAGKLNKWAI